MKVLVLCDDYWHPGEVVRRGLAPLEGGGFDFVEDAKDILSVEMLERYSVIINCKSDNMTGANDNPWFDRGITEVMPEHFEAFVRSGGGFLSIHSGNAFVKDDPSGYAAFVGNYFITHPPRCEVGVRIAARHPVTEGVNDFTLRDEHYQIGLTCGDHTVLFSTTSETGGVQTGGYVREIGKGRLCVLTLGHVLSAWLHPEYQRIVKNAIGWCAGEGL